MSSENQSKNNDAQAAIEYMLLLAIVVAITLIGFTRYFDRVHDGSDIFFNGASIGIMGPTSNTLNTDYN